MLLIFILASLATTNIVQEVVGVVDMMGVGEGDMTLVGVVEVVEGAAVMARNRSRKKVHSRRTSEIYQRALFKATSN